MKSLPLIGHTRRISAPANWDTSTRGICHTLEVSDSDGFMTSAWELTASERKHIAEGAPIYLYVGGTPQTQHPVVGFTVGTAECIVMRDLTETQTTLAAELVKEGMDTQNAITVAGKVAI